MQVRCGTDIISISRINKALDRQGRAFAERVWTSVELEDCKGAGRMASLAARFAAKEAASKALGSGIGVSGVHWKDLEISKRESGQPELIFHGAAQRLYQEMGAVSHSISLSHEGDKAIAFCVILCSRGEIN